MAKIKRGKVITITSMKGGVGKTMSTLLIANLFKRNKKKILIVDLDLYNGDIAFALNLDVKSSIYNLCDDVINNRYNSTTNDYLVKYDEYIDVLPSPKDPRQASKIDRKSLEIVLKSFYHRYDVILIDTNHILSVTNMVAFELSDFILNIFTNDALDLKSTKTFISICKNMNVENLHLVLNIAPDERKKYFSQYEIETIIKDKIDFIIPRNFYINNINKQILDGKVLENFDKLLKSNKEDVFAFSSSILKLLEDTKEDEENEKK